jgi:hypothetical protein
LTLAAPFPWFGGKRTVAAEVWAALGDPVNYVEPFAGSLAVLLGRPTPPHTETVNDADGLLCNAWRALRADPDGVALVADWPVSELDLHARHLRLIAVREELTERLIADPDYFDPRLAGWWIWGACCWIGSGWCSGRGPWTLKDGRVGEHGDRGQGVHRQRPHLGNRGSALAAYFGELAARLERVRVSCGDWSRVTGESVTIRHGLTGVFLDPPYPIEDSREAGLYAIDCGEVAHLAAAWAFRVGGNPLYRIVLAGYEGDHVAPPGWTVIPWKAKGGYGSQGDGRGRENAERERLWISPHCLRPDTGQISLFGGGR